MKVNSVEMTDHIKSVLNAGLTPMIHGDPGIGKSDIVKAIAAAGKMEVIDIRLSQCDPTDLNGFPHFLEKQDQSKGSIQNPTFQSGQRINHSCCKNF